MKGIIDRFEGEYAVVECGDGKIKNIKRSTIPAEAGEGDVLVLGDSISIDYAETKKRKEKIKELSKGIWK